MSRLGKRIFTAPKVEKWIYFFPVQLFLLHIQRNFILIFFWLFLLAYLTGALGSEFGIPYLFLYPEYLGSVNIWAYFINGLAFGAFVMSFNISSYIVNSRRFPFLATLNRPFFKYCLNNSVIPIAAIVVFIVRMIHTLPEGEINGWISMLVFILSWLGGLIIFTIVSLTYFYTLNKDVTRIRGAIIKNNQATVVETQKTTSANRAFRRLRKRFRISDECRVDTYLQSPVKISLTRGTTHYGTTTIMKVFQQNHVNAAFFELVIFVTLIVLGIFREIPVFKIPAGASVMLLFTMLLMLASAVHFILKKWSTLFFVGGFLILNQLTTYSTFSVRNFAYGLDYSDPIVFDPDSIQAQLIQDNPFPQDIRHHEKILQNWKAKNIPADGGKPYLIMVTCSGGGLKSAMWTFRVMQHIDSLTNGQFLRQTYMITGSSGGMIGAAYLRELYYMHEKGLLDDLYSDSLARNIGLDILNPVSTTLALNDMFVRLQSFTEGTYSYPKDRGYAFEKQLNENTGYLLDHRLADYVEPEASADIPLMIFAPTIINDSKRLIISAQPVSFLCNNLPDGNPTYQTTIEDLEFTRLFQKQNPYNLKFTSAIRMNATFPYILPSVSLPTLPSMQIMDAGVRDNYGIRTTVKYLFHMQNWIKQNTRGVILVKIHDSRPAEYNTKHIRSMLEHLLSPLGGIFNNMSRVHQQENDQLLQFAAKWFDGRLKIVDLRLTESLKEKEISMSLHLTQKEKDNIKRALYSPRIQTEIIKLKALMEPGVK